MAEEDQATKAAKAGGKASPRQQSPGSEGKRSTKAGGTHHAQAQGSSNHGRRGQSHPEPQEGQGRSRRSSCGRGCGAPGAHGDG